MPVMASSNHVAPKAFISYSWDDNDHRQWVAGFATRLRYAGVEVTLDQWHAIPGDNLPHFMEDAVRETDFVLLICTPAFTAKANGRTGGVGYEGHIMTAEVFTRHNERKFIPVLRKGEWLEVAPSWLLGKYYIDLRNDPYAEEAFKDLVDTLLGKRPVVPPVGTPGSSPGSESNALVELMALSDRLVSEIVAIESLAHTFGDRRRILDIIAKLHKALSVWTARVEPLLEHQMTESIRDFHRQVSAYLSEANYVLPWPEEDKYTKDRERLKDNRYRVITTWDGLKEVLLDHSHSRAAFEKLRNDPDTVFRFIGYADAKAVTAYIFPRTVDAIRNAGEIGMELLKAILATDGTNYEAWIAEGFPKRTVVETFNSLLRDEYLKIDDRNVYRMTPVGRRIVQDLLAKRTAAG